MNCETASQRPAGSLPCRLEIAHLSDSRLAAFLAALAQPEVVDPTGPL